MFLIVGVRRSLPVIFKIGVRLFGTLSGLSFGRQDRFPLWPVGFSAGGARPH